MMQSVVNGDDIQLFQNLDDDYILVQKPNDEEMKFDDDSYDCCEDGCSLCSVEGHDGSFSVNSESLENYQVEEMELIVPLVLMRDLDEAHEAAKIVRILDMEDDLSDMSVISNQQEPMTVEDFMIESRDTDDVTIKNIKGDDNVSINGNNIDPPLGYKKDKVPSFTRRASKKKKTKKKKHRKKLKVMKKALPAANTVQPIAEGTITSTNTSNESSSSTKWSRRIKKKKKTGSVCASKKRAFKHGSSMYYQNLNLITEKTIESPT